MSPEIVLSFILLDVAVSLVEDFLVRVKLVFLQGKPHLALALVGVPALLSQCGPQRWWLRFPDWQNFCTCVGRLAQHQADRQTGSHLQAAPRRPSLKRPRPVLRSRALEAPVFEAIYGAEPHADPPVT